MRRTKPFTKDIREAPRHTCPGSQIQNSKIMKTRTGMWVLWSSGAGMPVDILFCPYCATRLTPTDEDYNK